MKKALAFTLICAITLSIGWIFWFEDFRYNLPTPIPANYKIVPVNTFINLEGQIQNTTQKPTLLHFFNPKCPCSRFNLEHFRALYKGYKDKIGFHVVIPYESEVAEVQKLIAYSGIGIIRDKNKNLAETCGVYSTPQAVVMDREGKLYYRGNYNKSRYCTAQSSNFAQMALDSVLSQRAAPVFPKEATRAYGCELPDSTNQNILWF